MGLLGDVGGLVGAAGGVGIGLLNYGEQREQNTWQKHAYEYSLRREDTAVQRRAADLRAAGLSPVLAAGQGASTMAPINISAPQADIKPSELASAAMNMMLQDAEIGRTKEQEKLNAAQSSREKAQKELILKQKEETDYNLTIARKHKIPTGYRGNVADILYGVDAAEAAAERLRQKMEERKRIEQEAGRQRDRERNPDKYKKTTTGVQG